MYLTVYNSNLSPEETLIVISDINDDNWNKGPHEKWTLYRTQGKRKQTQQCLQDWTNQHIKWYKYAKSKSDIRMHDWEDSVSILLVSRDERKYHRTFTRQEQKWGLFRCKKRKKVFSDQMFSQGT